jgi:hypothetical protein
MPEFFPFLFIFLGIASVALFTFLAVDTFSEKRAKERVAYYQHETYKKLSEQPPEQAEHVIRVMREEERLRQRKQLEGLKLGGLITGTVGLTLGVFLYVLTTEAVAFVGLIPLGIGLAMLIYATLLAPKPGEPTLGDRKRPE